MINKALYLFFNHKLRFNIADRLIHGIAPGKDEADRLKRSPY